MNHREVAKRVLRIATGAEPTEDQVDRLVDARKDGLRMRFFEVPAGGIVNAESFRFVPAKVER